VCVFHGYTSSLVCFKLEKQWNNNNKETSSRYHLHYIVIARSDPTFKRLDIVEEYSRNNIAVLNPNNEINVIFLTNQSGYDYASKVIHELDMINYIVTAHYVK
jgi:hypothetical protein